MSPVSLTAFWLLAGGAVFLLIPWLYIQFFSRASWRKKVEPRDLPKLDETSAAMLVGEGGRLLAINSSGREIFGLAEDERPNLETMSRKVQPPDEFWRLCASGGAANLVVDGMLKDAEAVVVARGLLVTFHEAALADAQKGGVGADAALLGQMAEIGAALAAVPDLVTLIREILEQAESLVFADTIELSLWNEEEQAEDTYHLVGLKGEDHKVDMLRSPLREWQALTALVRQNREPIWMVDSHTDSPETLRQEYSQATFRSYIGLPLVQEGRFLGVLEYVSLISHKFSELDFQQLRLFASQVSFALRGWMLSRIARLREAEVERLRLVTEDVVTLNDADNLFARLVQLITPLIRSEILGYVIYDDERRTLEGKAPFVGIPPQFLEVFRTGVDVGSQLEYLLGQRITVFSQNAAEDPQWESIGLLHVSQSASMRQTILQPLISGGRSLGFLLASNPIDRRNGFEEDDLNLLAVIANHTAPVIDRLIREQTGSRRGVYASSLQKIANLVTLNLPYPELIRSFVQEIWRATGADQAALFLVARDRSVLELLPSAWAGEKPALPEWSRALSLEDPQFLFTVTGKESPLLTSRASASVELAPFTRQQLSYWGSESAVGVPLLTRSGGIGELWIGKRISGAFTQSEVEFLSTACSQVAALVEQLHLSAASREELSLRIEQMSNLARAGRDLLQSKDVQTLIERFQQGLLDSAQADDGSVLVFDPGPRDFEESLIHSYLQGDPLSEPVRQLALSVLENGKPQKIHDPEKISPLQLSQDIHSLYIAPLFVSGLRSGVTVLYSNRERHFGEDREEVIQSLISQAGMALNTLWQRQTLTVQSEGLKSELETLTRLVQSSRQIHMNRTLQEAMSVIGHAIQEATHFQVVVISIFDPVARLLRRIWMDGLPIDLQEEMRSRTQPWDGVQELLKDQFRMGDAFFIPVDRLKAIPEKLHSVRLPAYGEHGGPDAWDPDDMLLIPLYHQDGSPLGLVSLDNPASGLRPDEAVLKALGMFAPQVAFVIEGHRYINSINVSLSQPEGTVLESDTQRLLSVSGGRGIGDALEVQRMRLQVERIQRTRQILEVVQKQQDIPALMLALVNEILEHFDFQVALVAEATSNGEHLIQKTGYIPQGINPEVQFGQRNPLRQTLLDSQARFISDVWADNDWKRSALLGGVKARSCAALPFKITDEYSLAILLVNNTSVYPFQEEEKQILEQVAAQTTTSLQNLYLLTEMRSRLKELNLLQEFSRKLDKPTPEAVLSALVDTVHKVIPSCDACWVGLGDVREHALLPKTAVGMSDLESLKDIRFSLAGTSGSFSLAQVSLPGRACLDGAIRRIGEVHFSSDYSLPSEDLLRYKRATGDRVPISSLLVPLKMAERVMGVLVLDNYTVSEAFSMGDEALVRSLAQQAALALENASLFEASQKRTSQLQALTRISGRLTGRLETDHLIRDLLGSLREILPFETATLWLRKANRLEVAATQGFEDNQSRIGLSVDTEDSALFQEMERTNQEILVADVRLDERFPSLIEPENLSWLGIPMISQSTLVGMIALEKKQAHFYTQEEHIQVAKTFASQAAVALENAWLFEVSSRRTGELDERNQRLALLNRFSTELGSWMDVTQILALSSRYLCEALGADLVSVFMLEGDGRVVLSMDSPEQKASTPVNLPECALLERLKESLGVFHAQNVASEADLKPLTDVFLKPRNISSLLFVPLTTNVELNGWLCAATRANYRFSVSEIELARTIANQAAIALQNAILFSKTRVLTSELESRVDERTRELQQEHQKSRTLLQISTELSNSLDIEQVLGRTLDLLNKSLGAVQSMILVVGHATIRRQAGETLLTENMPAFETIRNISRKTENERAGLLIADLLSQAEWEAGELEGLPRSILGVSLRLGEETLGTLLLFHPYPKKFTLNQLHLVEAAAQQIAISLNNAELFNLIQMQAESLGSMLREQEISATRSRAILEAVADGVLVTASTGAVTLFNASAEHILNINSLQVIGNPLEQFSGLFGTSGQTWMKTISAWSKNPQAHRGRSTYEDQINLDDGRVVSIHLAPVIYGNEFLGTVSIFRDITHEVQVDRLKSEFVANVSHELRTPMTSIKGYVDIMLMGAAGPLGPQVKNFLEIVKNNTIRLGILVNDLLDVSRIEAGKITLTFQAVDLAQIVRDLTADFERRSKEEGRAMEFSMEIEADLPRVNGDLERVRHIVSCLLSNSYNYTPAGGKICVHLRVDDDMVQTDVVDNGVGIPLKDQNRIFERFYRGEDPLVLASAGTGLGLAISKILVEMHRGRIWFKSSGVPGEGCVFSFTLPTFRSEESV